MRDKEAFIHKIVNFIRVTAQITASLYRFSARSVQLPLSLLTMSFSRTKIVTYQAANGAAPDIVSRVNIFCCMPECGRITDVVLSTSIDDRI